MVDLSFVLPKSAQNLVRKLKRFVNGKYPNPWAILSPASLYESCPVATPMRFHIGNSELELLKPMTWTKAYLFDETAQGSLR
jgi:hypothetical protein